MAYLHHSWRDRFWGLAISLGIAMVGVYLSHFHWAASKGFSALTIAIILGMLIGNTFYGRLSKNCANGVDFSKRTLLRAGIVLFGLKLTLQNIMQVGVPGFLIDAIIILSTFIIATLVGTRLLGLDRKLSMLIGTGSAICGAAAVIGAEPVVKGRSEQVTIAVATVVVFGTIGIFLYPFMYSLHIPFMPSDPTIFGVYEGSTIHEVAQVAAAASSLDDPTAIGTAVITKMVRVILLAPFLIGLSAWLARFETTPHAHESRDNKQKIVIPWFAFGFIGVVLFNSLQLLPTSFVQMCIQIDTVLLAMAMGALGLTTHVNAIRQAGLKPILLGTLLFIWLVVGGAFINVGIYRLFR